ncbi:MAG: 3-hydroxyacyl-ACP dehydratase FabZ [Dehalococcoidales bacterium]|nr:3-hydroxyacyl-ACP dehydratase FabZ [Dehalococcoidales bacterium]
MLGNKEIKEIIPHRNPFLLVDRIVELSEDGSHAVGIKNVSANEPFFQGHFPDYAIMPGVLIVEALAQTAAAAFFRGEHRGKLGVLAGIDNFRFRRQVVPGDVLRLEVTMTKMRGPIGRLAAKASVEGQVAAEGEIIFAITSWPEQEKRDP